ncbi:MAG: DNA polymerase III subunit alpha, partial [Alphaproteobacteria bacterium]
MAPANFVHLRVHSAYSLAEGAIRTPEILSLCKEFEMPAVGIADTGNLFGALEMSDKLASGGVQPVIGCSLLVDIPELNAQAKESFGGNRLNARPTLKTLAIFAMNEQGYLNLMELSSRAFLDTDGIQLPHISLDLLKKHHEGLILLTGGPDGPINHLVCENKVLLARDVLVGLQDVFGDRLYVELQRHSREEEGRAEPHLLELAYDLALPIVATNEPYFPKRDMYEAHDALLCIAEGAYVMQDDRRTLTEEHYFKSPKEMELLFADLPEAIDNTVEIARRCHFFPKSRGPILPKFSSEEGLDEAAELRRQAEAGLKDLLARNELYVDEQAYWDRLEKELDIIITMDFPGYFLIVSDFMKWTRAQNIPVGVRGSGAASIVAWTLDITNLDPLRFDLVFERFLNPERVSMPDFDIDFCQERRHEVIEYVQDKYGHDRVAQIITYGKFQARMALRDVGRVLQMPYPQVDRLCKLVPNNPANPTSLTEALVIEPKLREARDEEEIVDRMLKIAISLEGLYRNASTHAAGVVIADRPLQELVPVYRDPRSDMPVTQFSMKWVEPAGLVKFDFLGLKTLTVIAKTERLLARRGIKIKTDQVPFDDEKAYEMLARGDSIGIFQLESSGMKDLLKKMKPDRIEDLIALVALYRPGPMDSIPRYIACKHGREEPEYLHPMLEPILKTTFGVMTYQEDVLQIARDLAGYTLGEADLLRRAMGKKIPEEMDMHRSKFIEGAGLRGIEKSVAEKIFDQAAKFAGYGFNKAHAAAYAQVAYQTAYLKANFPVEFFAGAMCLDMGNTDKLAIIRQEALRLGIVINPPNINVSEADFSVRDGEIDYALGAIKNVGRQAMEHIVEERKANGPFGDLFDFARRVDPKQINKRTFENLTRAGAFDSLNPNRAQVLASAEMILNHAHLAADERQSSQESLFGDAGLEMENPPLPAVNDWMPLDRLGEELAAVGFYLSGHPLDDYQLALRQSRVTSYAELLADPQKKSREVRLAGTIITKQVRKSQRTGKPFAFIMLTDPTGQFEVTLFSEAIQAAGDLLEVGQSIVLTADAQWEGTADGDEQLRLLCRSIASLDSVAANAASSLKV